MSSALALRWELSPKALPSMSTAFIAHCPCFPHPRSFFAGSRAKAEYTRTKCRNHTIPIRWKWEKTVAICQASEEYDEWSYGGCQRFSFSGINPLSYPIWNLRMNTPLARSLMLSNTSSISPLRCLIISQLRLHLIIYSVREKASIPNIWLHQHTMSVMDSPTRFLVMQHS